MPKPIKITLILGLIFAIGLASGVLMQKFYPVGYILWQFGVYQPLLPTPSPPFFERSVSEEHIGKLHLFVLAGQSNMSGQGQLPSQEEWHPQIYLFGNDYRWRLAKEPIDSPINQVDTVSIDENPRAKFSPALKFAQTLVQQQPDLLIGLIPCAKSDTTLYHWRHSFSEDTLYGSCLKRVRAASPMGTVAGLLIFQGESDAKDSTKYSHQKPSADDYAERFTSFVQQWRTDLERPDLPTVFAQIGTTTDLSAFVNWEKIKQQQSQVNLPCSTMITTDDLSLGDFVHFDTVSYKIIGERFALAYIDLLNEHPECVSSQ